MRKRKTIKGKVVQIKYYLGRYLNEQVGIIEFLTEASIFLKNNESDDLTVIPLSNIKEIKIV